MRDGGKDRHTCSVGSRAERRPVAPFEVTHLTDPMLPFLASTPYCNTLYSVLCMLMGWVRGF